MSGLAEFKDVTVDKQFHIGPIEMESGTLTAKDKEEIKKQTGCIAQLRGRGGAGRQFTLKGPADQEEKAYQLCKELIEKNGNTGGRKSRDDLPRKPPLPR